jgi:uncharacterized protein (TIGR03790 family)
MASASKYNMRTDLLSFATGLALFLGVFHSHFAAARPGDEVVVIYNSRMPESKGVAEYYAEKRLVPREQIIGLDLPVTEEILRATFRKDLERPLWQILKDRKLWQVGGHLPSPTNLHPGKVDWTITASKIRYAVLCYGVPLHIAHDPALREEGLEKLKTETRRNGAAVESELSLLPHLEQNLPITGPLRNPIYGSTNTLLLHPTNGVLLVTRLDGPSASIARGLVDKALEAEREGLWGRAYIDVRNITEPGFKEGDAWMKASGEICRRLGFETVVDENAGTFPAGFPMSHIAMYIGWYTDTASGPFAQPTVEFMPGAFAYHLHSFSASTIRSTTRAWVGPLLAKGATCTMGNVDEPYLAGTPEMAIFAARFIFERFTFAEAAYASQPVLSWQCTVIGDPLYRPFEQDPQLLHQSLFKSNNPKLEWSYLRLLNLNQQTGKPMADLITLLDEIELTKHSAVLMEKAGDLYAAQGKPTSAAHAWAEALKLKPSPQQRLRLLLELGEKLPPLDRSQEAYDFYHQLLTEFPDYPDKIGVDRKILPLAQKLGHKAEVQRLEIAIRNLPGA